MNKHITVVPSVVVLLSGCANFTSPAREHSLDSSRHYWFDYDASRRGAVMVSENANI